MIPWAIQAHNPNRISIGSAVSAQMTAECFYTLQWDAPFPLKIAPTHGVIWIQSNTCFLGLTRVLNPNGISIGSAVFAGFTSVTDRPTDHATRSVTIGHILRCSLIITTLPLEVRTLHSRYNVRLRAAYETDEITYTVAQLELTRFIFRT